MSTVGTNIVYIMDAGEPPEPNELRLPAGETALQRQLRLLWMCGVRDFIIEAEHDRKQAAEYLPEGGRLWTAYEEKIYEEAAEREILLLQSNIVFDLGSAEAMLRTEGAFAVLARGWIAPGLTARVGMRTVEEIALGLSGPDCFSLLPVCGLPGCAVRQASQSAREAGVRLGEVIWPQLPVLGAAPFFVEAGAIRVLRSREELEAIRPVLRERDKDCRILFRERGAASQLPAVLERLGIQKPLLICGPSGGEGPIKALLAICQIRFAVQRVEGSEPQLEQIRQGINLYRLEGCDGILSAGGPAVIETAKCESLFLRCGEEEPFHARSWCPHVALPDGTFGVEGDVCAPDAARTVEHDGLVPDAVLQDDGLWDSARPRPSPAIYASDAPAADRRLGTVSGKLRRSVLSALYRSVFSIRDQTVLLEAYSGGADAHRAIYEAMQSRPEYDGFAYIWAAADLERAEGLPIGPETDVVELHSRRYIRAAATARFLISSVDLPEYVRPRQEQIYIRTWNGELADGSRDRGRVTSLHSPGPAVTPALEKAFGLPGRSRKGIVVEAGCPQNAFLFRYTREDIVSAKLRLGCPLDKRIVFWKLDWRPADIPGLRRELEGCLLLVWEEGSELPDLGEVQGASRYVGPRGTLNDLLVTADLLVTDDARLVQRYANLKRPIVFCRTASRNLGCGYLNLDELPGETVEERSALARAVKKGLLGLQDEKKYQYFLSKYAPLEGPDAGVRFAEKLIPARTFPTPRQKKQQSLHRWLHNGWIRGQGLLRKTGWRRTPNDRRLLSFRNKHQGGRCFLVGNGPSLTLSDLEAIRGEYSFCCNRIYLIFDRTNWRPTYYFVTDNVFSGQPLAEIKAAFPGVIFTNHAFHGARQGEERLVYAYTLAREDYFVHGDPLEYYVSSQATVMTYMIEMAIYMGFQTIYLLGVDSSNSFAPNSGHFSNGYYDRDMMRLERRRTKLLASDGKQLTIEGLGRYRQERSTRAYTQLREYADRHGVKIFNATRGGHLEVFDRVDLADLKLRPGPAE